MDRKWWKRTILKQCQAVGTYDPAFDSVIDTLSQLLEQRDCAYAAFVAEGGEVCIEHTQDRGAKNLKKNPMLQVWMDLNAQALAYWRDLGLTPAGLKRINDAAMQKPKVSVLAQALKELA